VARPLICVIALIGVLIAPGAALGQGLTDSGETEGDHVLINGDEYVPPDRSIDGIFIVNGNVRIDGTVNGDVIAISAPVYVTQTGTVTGDLVALSDRAYIQPGGTVDGDIVYADEKPQVLPDARVTGDVRRLDADEIVSPGGLIVAHIAIWLAFSISTLALGLLALWLTPRAAQWLVEVARSSYAPAIAWGLGVFIGLPIVAVIALITLVGIPFGIALLLALFPLFVLAYTTSAWVLGRVIVGPPRGRVVSFLAGWAILRAIALIPVLGAIVWLAATVFGLGVLAAALWRQRSTPEPERRPEPAPA
jgi:cytoskeletal protein CcmA (bactofilin family)